MLNEETAKYLEFLLENIKMQTQVYLLDAGEFYPFGAAIDSKEELAMLSAMPKSDHPLSDEVIDLLENSVKKDIENGKLIVAAIAIDVKVTKYDLSYDALQIRFFDPYGTFKAYYKYEIKEHQVEFTFFQI